MLSKNAFADKNDHKNYPNMSVSSETMTSVEADLCSAKGSMAGLLRELILQKKIIKRSACFHLHVREPIETDISFLEQVWGRLWKVGRIL